MRRVPVEKLLVLREQDVVDENALDADPLRAGEGLGWHLLGDTIAVEILVHNLALAREVENRDDDLLAVERCRLTASNKAYRFSNQINEKGFSRDFKRRKSFSPPKICCVIV